MISIFIYIYIYTIICPSIHSLPFNSFVCDDVIMTPLFCCENTSVTIKLIKTAIKIHDHEHDRLPHLKEVGRVVEQLLVYDYPYASQTLNSGVPIKYE